MITPTHRQWGETQGWKPKTKPVPVHLPEITVDIPDLPTCIRCGHDADGHTHEPPVTTA